MAAIVRSDPRGRRRFMGFVRSKARRAEALTGVSLRKVCSMGAGGKRATVGRSGRCVKTSDLLFYSAMPDINGSFLRHGHLCQETTRFRHQKHRTFFGSRAFAWAKGAAALQKMAADRRHAAKRLATTGGMPDPYHTAQLGCGFSDKSFFSQFFLCSLQLAFLIRLMSPLVGLAQVLHNFVGSSSYDSST